MDILVIKNKEDLKNKTREELIDNNILVEISLNLYKELLMNEEEFCEDDRCDNIAIRCPNCGCSSFLGNRSYVVKMTIVDGRTVSVYDKCDGGDTDKEIFCDFCGYEYKLDN